MKNILLLLLAASIFMGCENISNTPTPAENNFTKIAEVESGTLGISGNMVNMVKDSQGTLYLATTQGLLSRASTLDEKGTWTSVAYGAKLAADSHIRALATSGNTIYAAHGVNLVAIPSTGASEQTVTTTAVAGTINSIYAKGTNVYLATTAGVFLSQDSGAKFNTSQDTDKSFSAIFERGIAIPGGTINIVAITYLEDKKISDIYLYNTTLSKAGTQEAAVDLGNGTSSIVGNVISDSGTTQNISRSVIIKGGTNIITVTDGTNVKASGIYLHRNVFYLATSAAVSYSEITKSNAKSLTLETPKLGEEIRALFFDDDGITLKMYMIADQRYVLYSKKI